MIDDHVHPFPLSFTPFDPAGISLRTPASPGYRGAGAVREAGGRLFQELLTGQLAELLGCRPEELGPTRDAR
ncbi:MAG: hypothetical protein ACRDZQ_05640, partial [Acidimicrobiales bacterium]